MAQSTQQEFFRVTDTDFELGLFLMQTIRKLI